MTRGALCPQPAMWVSCMDAGGEVSGADFLHSTAEAKPEHSEINLLDQDGWEVQWEKGNTLHKASGTFCCNPRVASSQGTAIPPGPLAHTTGWLPRGTLPAVCMLPMEKAAARQHAGLGGVTEPAAHHICHADNFLPEARQRLSCSAEGRHSGEFCCLFWRCVLGFPELSICCSFPLFWSLHVCGKERIPSAEMLHLVPQFVKLQLLFFKREDWLGQWWQTNIHP